MTPYAIRAHGMSRLTPTEQHRIMIANLFALWLAARALRLKQGPKQLDLETVEEKAR